MNKKKSLAFELLGDSMPSIFLRVKEYIAKGVWLCITMLCKAYEALLKYDVIFVRDVLRFASLLGFGVYVSPPVTSV